jgi:hypothetical protein
MTKHFCDKCNEETSPALKVIIDRGFVDSTINYVFCKECQDEFIELVDKWKQEKKSSA